MKTIGDQLKKAREDKGLTINEVAVATKINPKVLTALEDGDLDKLPPKSFLRGFVRTYSMYLKLNTDEILELFGQEMGKTVYTSTGLQNSPSSGLQNQASGSSQAEPIAATQPNPHRPKIGLPPIKLNSKILMGVGIAVMFVIVASLKGVVDKYEKESVVDPLPKIEPVSTASEPVPALPSQPSTAPTPTQPVQKPLAQQPPAPPPTEIKPTEVKPPAPPPTEIKPTAATTPQTVIIEALDKVTLAIRVDNGEAQRVTLSPDQVHTIKGQSVVYVDVSDGGAVNIIHNGREKGVPGDLGKPIKIKFP